MDFSILSDIVIIFALSIFVNMIFRKLKIPTVVGYLLTGILVGPHVFSLLDNEYQIEIMAEIGVILLLFSIGLEFSLKHLLRIRRIVFIGGFLQVGLSALLFFALSYFYPIGLKSRLFIGFVAALSSSAIVMKLLQERSEITSNYGRTVLGILIFQDLMLVPLLLFSDFFTDGDVSFSKEFLMLLAKTLLILVFVYVGNKWLFPRILRAIAMTHNQELFFMSILLICFGVAVFTMHLGMSLAFGAFLAGLMVSESEYSHNAFGSLMPLKDTFASFFFVSVGLLLDLNFVVDNIALVIVTVLLVLLVKTVVAGATGFLLGHTFKGTVMIGFALSQVGEFSFILAKVGLDKNIIDNYYYQLFLAVAIITMSIAPFMIQLASPFANLLLKLPLPNFLVKGLFPLKEIEIPNMKNHAVIIGKDPVALKLSLLSKYVDMPYLSIIFDPQKVKELQKKGENVIYGDAVNVPILKKAHVDNAEIVVVSVGSLMPSLAIIENVRNLNKHAFILVRTKNIHDIEPLFKVGADQIFPENFEIAIDLFGRILNRKLMHQKDINTLMGKIRNDFYGIFRKHDSNHQLSIFDELPNVEISAVKINDNSIFVNKTPSEINLRNEAKVTLVAIKRGSQLIEHPGPNTKVFHDDILYLLGSPDQIAGAISFLSSE